MIIKTLLAAFALLAAMAASAQATDTYTIDLGQFSKVRVTDNARVVYRNNPDSTGCAQYRGAKEFADAFILSVKQGQLRVQVSTEDVGNPDLPILYIYSDFLSSMESSSDLPVIVESCAPCAEMALTLVGNGTLTAENVRANVTKAYLKTGNGTINVSGRTREAVFRMLGTGLISADRLEAEKVTCSILGSGSIGCWPLESLQVKGIGSTKIYYKGNPSIKKSGGGKLFPLPEEGSFDTVVTGAAEEEEVIEEE